MQKSIVMHHLFEFILEKKDLSRAGELFSIPDAVISDDLSEIVRFLSDMWLTLFGILHVYGFFSSSLPASSDIKNHHTTTVLGESERSVGHWNMCQ